MSKKMRNAIIIVIGLVIVAAVLVFYFNLPTDGLQYGGGTFSSGREDEGASYIKNEEADGTGSDGIRLISSDLTCARGDVASLKIRGIPNTLYSIKVKYKWTTSQARGLEDKVSDEYGFVEWEWKISSNVANGIYDIEISGGGSVCNAWIQVVE